MTAATPLIIVRDLREVVGAGYGNATASVRTLDGVSLAVHPGELLLVDSPVAGGASALRSALAAPRRTLTGSREVSAGVRVRRATISHHARDLIVSTWASHERILHERVSHAETPVAARVVYLLRVRASGASTANAGSSASPGMHNAWRDWACALRASQGAVVLFSSAPDTTRAPSQQTHRAVHESDLFRSRGRVRVLRMSAGRVVSEQVLSAGPESPASPWGDSDASRSPSVSSRCSTGSTAPSSRGDGAPC